MKYRGTIAYRAGLGGNVPEGFLASVVSAWDFLLRETNQHTPSGQFKDGTFHGCVWSYSNFHFMRGLSCMLHDSANQIAEGFLGDWVLFLDTDHVFKSDAFYEMVTTFEAGLPDGSKIDILTGFAQKRVPPYLPIIMKTNFNPLQSFDPIIPGPIEKHTLIPIDATGLGCLMVRREVFTSIASQLNEKPFDFRSKFYPPVRSTKAYYEGIWQGADTQKILQLPADRRSDEFYWEDISFFWRAALLGFKAWCAPWIKFHHIETRLVTDDLMQIESRP